MNSHEPPGYTCPFCRIVAGQEDELNSRGDIVARTDAAMAFISPRWWPNNRGHVLVIPLEHHENLYVLPPAAGHAVHDLAQRIAVAMRESYGCTGISTRQHNEPDGSQDVWHYHVHVFPRYSDDGLYRLTPLPEFATAEERRPYADRLRQALAD
ncbi:MAG TPA: HIT domain-containing protein [Mycobacteriales bacterium]|nr:HIT domain-containing protein [Mycobacteriales bacterium]